MAEKWRHISVFAFVVMFALLMVTIYIFFMETGGEILPSISITPSIDAIIGSQAFFQVSQKANGAPPVDITWILRTITPAGEIRESFAPAGANQTGNNLFFASVNEKLNGEYWAVISHKGRVLDMISRTLTAVKGESVWNDSMTDIQIKYDLPWLNITKGSENYLPFLLWKVVKLINNAKSRLRCTAQGFPAPRVTIKRFGRLSFGPKTNVTSNVGFATIDFNPFMTELHSGYYSCIASKEGKFHRRVAMVMPLKGKYPGNYYPTKMRFFDKITGKKTPLTDDPEPLNKMEMKVDIVCELDSDPPSAPAVWKGCLDVFADPNCSLYTKIYNGTNKPTITYDNVTDQPLRRFRCESFNIINKLPNSDRPFVFQELKFLLPEPPLMRRVIESGLEEDDSGVIQVPPDTDLTLMCHTSQGYPQPTLQWTKNGYPLPDGVLDKTKVFGRTRMRIPKAWLCDWDSGVFNLNATNLHGSNACMFIVNVTTSGRSCSSYTGWIKSNLTETSTKEKL